MGEVFISRENIAKLGLDPAQEPLTLTDANTEYSFEIPDGTKRLIIGIRSGGYSFRYGWATGNMNFTVPAGAFRDISDVHLVGKTLYAICPDAAGQILEIEYFL